ncbi:MAG: leucyl/phenylalanyl-tRNA--protein transferase, partial [Verrucomicrobiota bacterium]
MNIKILGRELWFPHPDEARDDGLLAIGGDLSAERLILAYRSGIFPWSVNPITWWSPNPRAIFDIENFSLPRRMRQIMRQNKFQFTLNKAFTDVMRECAKAVPGREETWISHEFIQAYTDLHHRGIAHSVECWQDGILVGGLYGVAIGSFFAGESKFHRVSNASKLCLGFLMDHLRDQEFMLFDTQTANEHTLKLGAKLIPRKVYLQKLK